jgi:energy-coupling factor transporter ATP-binding protein EcfA2
VGRNGSGKTTLLRLLAFLERPASCDSFRYSGGDVHDRSGRQGIGFLRQVPWVFRGSVAGNLGYPLAVRRVSRTEIRRRVRAIAERLDLGRYLGVSARSLSGGEQKRVALGRLLVAEPKLLLLDEPMAHLDAASRDIMEKILVESESAVVLTTHDLGLALRLCDRSVTLEQGRVSAGLPENSFGGICDGDTLRTARGMTIRLPRPVREPAAIVVIDPTRIRVATNGARPCGPNAYASRVESIQAQGASIRLGLRGQELVTAVLDAGEYERLGLNVNRRVTVSFRSEDVQVV